MPIVPDALVIGLTGPFGSGCTTSADILGSRAGFTPIKLSKAIRDEWAKKHNVTATREQLQSLGDQMRKDKHSRVAELTVASLKADATAHTKIALDGIRNVGEIQYLRETFGHRFFLFALECPQSERWERLKPDYESKSLGRDDFNADDRRDKDEEVAYGQQVQLCVDRSDVLIVNDDEVTQVKLQKKLLNFVKLVIGEEPRYATPAEILMNIAYSASHGSKCLKRQVGAVLVAAPPFQMGDVVGTAFNENPNTTHPCVEEPAYGADSKRGVRGLCYRDKVRFEAFEKYAKRGWKCPKCAKSLSVPENQEPPWLCTNIVDETADPKISCGARLEEYFFPERAMTWCTAIHAEVAAVLAAGHRAQGTTLYTTTFPCFQCAEKIAQAGISAILFTEPYPDTQAADRLDLAKIKTARFEGVRSSRFHEIFSLVRPYYERHKIIAGSS